MGYFPLYVDLKDKTWLIVGGGPVALRKARDLLDYGALVRVVALEAEEELKRLEGAVRLDVRAFEDADLEQVDFVIAATSDALLNCRISRMCRERRIPVNVVDVKEECTFIFPSVIQEGPITIGISTGGMSPVIARWLKERIREALPEHVGTLTDELGIYREKVKALFPSSPRTRTELFYELARTGLENNCRLTSAMAETIIQRKLEQEHG